MKKIEDKLSIIITTYNRPVTFDKTLESLVNSPIKNCRITILDNHSTEDTRGVYEKYANQFANISFHSHKINLGGGCENYIHAIDYCDTEYMWILADDDSYDFSVFEDVASHVLEGDVDLIQVGAHNDAVWDWGVVDTPRNLFDKGYNYFKYSSFLPCTIFKYEYFCKYIKEAYDFIHYRYPHFPCLIHAFENNNSIYVSKKRIVTAEIGGQAYSYYACIRGFVVSSGILSSKHYKREMIDTLYDKIGLVRTYLLIYYSCRNQYDIVLVLAKLQKVMTIRERLMVYLLRDIYCFIKRQRTLKQSK